MGLAGARQPAVPDLRSADLPHGAPRDHLHGLPIGEAILGAPVMAVPATLPPPTTASWCSASCSRRGRPTAGPVARCARAAEAFLWLLFSFSPYRSVQHLRFESFAHRSCHSDSGSRCGSPRRARARSLGGSRDARGADDVRLLLRLPSATIYAVVAAHALWRGRLRWRAATAKRAGLARSRRARGRRPWLILLAAAARDARVPPHARDQTSVWSADVLDYLRVNVFNRTRGHSGR